LFAQIERAGDERTRKDLVSWRSSDGVEVESEGRSIREEELEVVYRTASDEDSGKLYQQSTKTHEKVFQRESWKAEEGRTTAPPSCSILKKRKSRRPQKGIELTSRRFSSSYKVS